MAIYTYIYTHTQHITPSIFQPYASRTLHGPQTQHKQQPPVTNIIEQVKKYGTITTYTMAAVCLP